VNQRPGLRRTAYGASAFDDGLLGFSPTIGADVSTDFTEHVFAIVDKRDSAAFAALFAPDGRFVFGNADPIVGPAAIGAAVGAFFAGIDGLRHELRNTWVLGADTVAELVVEYDRTGGGSVRIPAVTIFTRDQAGLVSDYRIYVDLAPLFA
jgi:ketosteroid isomerase-like protein